MKLGKENASFVIPVPSFLTKSETTCPYLILF